MGFQSTNFTEIIYHLYISCLKLATTLFRVKVNKKISYFISLLFLIFHKSVLCAIKLTKIT